MTGYWQNFVDEASKGAGGLYFWLLYSLLLIATGYILAKVSVGGW